MLTLSKPLSALLLFGITFSSLNGATLQWDNNGNTTPDAQDGAGTWNTSNLNWWNGSANVSWNNANNDTASFGTSGVGSPGTITIGTAISAGGLTVGSVAASATRTFQTGSITLSTGAIVDIGALATADFFSTTFSAAGGFVKEGTGRLTLRNHGTIGDIQVNRGVLDIYNTSTTGLITVSNNAGLETHSSTNWTMAGLIYNSTASSGLSAFSGNSTYTIGAGGLTMGGGGNLTIQADSTVTSRVILKGDLTMTGTINTGATIGVGGTGAATQKLLDFDAGTRNVTVASGSTLAIAAIIQNGGITKKGTGILRLSGANTYALGTSVEEGTLELIGAGTLGSTTANLSVSGGALVNFGGTSQTVNGFSGAGTIYNNTNSTTSSLTVGSDNASSEFSGVIRDNLSGSGKVALVKNGTGRLTLSGTNTYTGGTIVNTGILQITNSTEYVGNTTAVNGLGGAASALTLNGGTTLEVRANGASDNSAQTFTYGNAVTVAGDVTIDVRRESATNTGTNKTLAFGALSIGSNTLTVQGANNYVMRFSSAALTGDATFNVVATSANLTVNGAINGAGRSVTKLGNGTLTYTGGTYKDLLIEAGLVDIFGTTNNDIITVNGAGRFTTHSGNNLTVNTLIYNSTGTSNFYAAGTSATYTIGTGGLTMSRGTLTLNNEANTAPTIVSRVVLKGNVTATGTSAITDGGGTGVRTVDLDGGNRSFTVSAGATHTVGVNVQNGAITKEGDGILAMTAANTYAGGTVVNGGTFLAGNTTGSATGTGNVTVNATGRIGGNGSITGADAGSITLSSGTLLVGNTHAAGGTSQRLQLGALTSSTVAVNLNGTLQFDIFNAGSTLAIGNEAYDTLNARNDLLVINTAGVLDLNNAVIAIAAANTTSWAVGQTWKLIDWSNFQTSGFSANNVSLQNDVFGSYRLTYQIVQSGSGAGLYVTASLVPEPSKAILLLAGVVFMVTRRRRR